MKFTQRINQAIIFATQAHDGQMRHVSSTPYISHPFSLAIILSEYTDSEDVIIASILHDVIEDVDKEGFTYNDIKEKFGNQVLEIVLGCTEPPKNTGTWYERKQIYLDNVLKSSPESALVMLADHVHNCMCLLLEFDEYGPSMWQSFFDQKKGRMWFYENSLKNFKEILADHPLVSELERYIGQISKLPE